MVRAEIKKIILNYRVLLERANIPVKRVVLFGSYARGTERKDSDIDLGIISEEFGQDEMKESSRINFLKWKLDNRIEAHPISSKDYDTIATPFINEVRKYGVEVS
ncbi:MAG: nucleotidyltransferase domain-containing protein [Patescibacteria group bacterium]|mgnify:CR=1 FL=1